VQNFDFIELILFDYCRVEFGFASKFWFD